MKDKQIKKKQTKLSDPPARKQLLLEKDAVNRLFRVEPKKFPTHSSDQPLPVLALIFRQTNRKSLLSSIIPLTVWFCFFFIFYFAECKVSLAIYWFIKDSLLHRLFTTTGREKQTVQAVSFCRRILLLTFIVEKKSVHILLKKIWHYTKKNVHLVALHRRCIKNIATTDKIKEKTSKIYRRRLKPINWKEYWEKKIN